MQNRPIRNFLCFTASLFILLPCLFAASASAQKAGEKKEEGEAAAGLPAVRLDGNYFSKNGRRFIPVGVNWVPAKAAMEWPYEWDPASIERDFAQMHDLGVNVVRLDLVWAWFEPRPDQYNEEAFNQLHFLSQLANRYQIYLHPMLLIGGEVGEAYWDVPYRYGRHPHADPEMLRLETDFSAEIARRFGNESAILAWDLTDEPPFWIVADSTTDAMAINWTRLIAGAIHKYDHLHPLVVGTSMEDVGHGAFRPDNLRDEVDFLSVHPYTIYAPKLFPDAMLSARGTFGAAFETELSGSVGKPVMIQELGSSSAQYDPQRIAQYDETMMYSSLGAGANGFLIWCYTDAAPAQYAKVPYLRSPHETQFGLVTWDRKERPAAGMFRDFSRVMAKLDLDGVQPAPAEAAILVPNEWSKPRGDESRFELTGPAVVPYTSTLQGGSVAGQTAPSYSEENDRLMGAWLSSYILVREADLKADFPREYTDWQKYRMVLLPSPLTSTDTAIHLHTDLWKKAEAYVRQGGALYTSLNGDAAIPDMEPLFGARLVDHVPVTDVTLRVIAPFGNLHPGDTFHYTSGDSQSNWAATLDVKGGQVIAVDQVGRPALVANHTGRGTTLLCAYPLELYLASEPSAFDKDQPTYRIYEALRQETGIAPPFATGTPLVEESVLQGPSGGYVVLVNHSASKQSVHLTASIQVGGMARISAQAETSLKQSDGSWLLEIDPFAGTILRFQGK